MYTIDPALFIGNRRRLRQWLKPGQAVLLRAGKPVRRSGDTDYPFRQRSDFFWATGIDQSDSALIVTPDQELLFIRETSQYEQVWLGPRLSAEEARAISGVETVKLLDQLDKFSKQLHAKAPRRQLMASLRAIKHPLEVDLIKRAVQATKAGFEASLAKLNPGVAEYELEAELIHQFRRHGASGVAYEPIVASGANGCILHYVENDQVCRGGELVLIDAGAEYSNYAADITRVWPVNGRFSKRQHDVYESVWRVQKEAMKLLVPGAKLREYERQVGEMMTEELIKLKLLTSDQVNSQDPKRPLYRKYYMHGTSHFLGLDVHDVGDYAKPLASGMVLTCEPGIYIKDEGIGVRLEDDILITEQGPVNLSADIPIDPDEIEESMAASK
ncbi:aminopeptidase P N-terminal domain-containing protein [Candidatus Parcubacteria bacterium]|nr:aminopeptidase P N-terminal domain-containing protein [Candidatus Parcubacteria bacterium]